MCVFSFLLFFSVIIFRGQTGDGAGRSFDSTLIAHLPVWLLQSFSWPSITGKIILSYEYHHQGSKMKMLHYYHKPHKVSFIHWFIPEIWIECPNMYTRFHAKVTSLIPSKIQCGSYCHDAYHLEWLVDVNWMIILRTTATHWVLQRGIWFCWDLVTIGIGLEQRPGRILLKSVLLLKALECLRIRKDHPRQEDNQMEALVGMPGHTPQCLCIGCIKGLNFILWTLKRPRTVIYLKVRKWGQGEDIPGPCQICVWGWNASTYS